MFNLVVLTGRLTSNPELKTTPSGISVTTFSLAVDRPYRKDKEQEADFINIIAWRQTAEFITRYFTKGSLIGIEGSIQTRRYQDKNNNNRTAFEVVANKAQFVMPKSASEKAFNEEENNSSFAEETPCGGNTEDFEDIGDMSSDDDLPF